MLLTDFWEALEYTNLEPPIHLIMRPVAAFFGYKFAEHPQQKQQGTNPSSQQAASWIQMFGGAKPKEQLPAHIRNSPELKKMFDSMKSSGKPN